MSERRDDTPEPSGTVQPTDDERERVPGSYYYDDGTGYQVYTPENEEDAEEETSGDEPR